MALKPNGISRTIYPSDPCNDYTEWAVHITRKEIEHDANAFKSKFDKLWDDFRLQIINATQP